MKTYFTVIPALFDVDNKPVQDLKEMSPLAIVAMNTLGVHIYTVKGKGWDKGIWDSAYTELHKFLDEATEALPDYAPTFVPPCSISTRECTSETAMIGRFFHDMKLLGLNTLHSWNLVFDIDCMDYACGKTTTELQGIMEATKSSYFLGRKKRQMGLNSVTSKSDRSIPTSGNIKFSDDLTQIGFPLKGGMKGSMALTSVYRDISGHRYYSYQHVREVEPKGLDAIVDLQKEFPASFLAEEIISLYKNALLNVIFNERYPEDSV